MASSNNQCKENAISSDYGRVRCGVCGVIRRIISARPCFRKSDTRVINKVVYVSYGMLAVLFYLTVHTSNFMADRSIELARLQAKIDRAHELQAAKMAIMEIMDIKVDRG